MSFNKLQSLNLLEQNLGGLGQAVNEIQAIDNIASKFSGGGNITSGLYTPSTSGLTNLTLANAREAQFLRVGKTVFVSGILDTTPIALGVWTVLMSLPVFSDIQTAKQLAGSFTNNMNSTNGNAPLTLQGDIPTNNAFFSGTVVTGPAVATSSFYTFGYTIFP